MISLGCCNLHFLNLTTSSFSPGTKPRAHRECAKLGVPGKVKVGGSGRGTKFHGAHPARCEQCSQMVPQVKLWHLGREKEFSGCLEKPQTHALLISGVKKRLPVALNRPKEHSGLLL